MRPIVVRNSSFSLKKYLFTLLLITIYPVVTGRIHYITSTNVYRDCEDICGFKGLECNSQQMQEMDCQYAASDICGKMVTNDNNNYFQCTYGGCFMNCDYGLYTSKSVGRTSCTSNTDCYNRQGSPLFSRICACESDESVALSVWQIIGIATGVFFFFTILCALLMYFYMEYSLKQEYRFSKVDESDNGNSEKQTKENDGGDKTWSERCDQGKESCLSCWTAFALMVTAACAACWLYCRGNNDKSPSSPEQSSKKEKKEKKSWLKLKYGRKEKKRVPAPEPESGWYKEGGLPSTYDKPVVKEKKKYSYIDEDEESSDVVAESGRYQRRAGSEKVLSAYREYQESSDVERGKQDQTDVRPTDPKQSLSINSATGPPPLLSQRRNSAPPVTTTQNPITPSYQPKPVQAPPLLSQRSKEIANPLLLQSDVEVSDSMRSRQSASQAPIDDAPAVVWQAGPGKVVTVSRRDTGYDWDAQSHVDSSAVSDSSNSDLSYASSVQQSRGRRIRGGQCLDAIPTRLNRTFGGNRTKSIPWRT